jgi:hypothetical protein
MVEAFGRLGKPEARRILERPKYRREGNLKMDVTEIGCHVDWIYLAQDRIQ